VEGGKLGVYTYQREGEGEEEGGKYGVDKYQ